MSRDAKYRGQPPEGFSELADREFVIGRVDFAGQGRSRVMLKNRGTLHVYAEPYTGRFRGGEMIGPHVEHLAHLLAWAHQSELTVGQILERPFYHPTVEEGVRTALRDADSQVKAERLTALAS